MMKRGEMMNSAPYEISNKTSVRIHFTTARACTSNHGKIDPEKFVVPATVPIRMQLDNF